MKNAIFTGTDDGKFFAAVIPKKRVANMLQLINDGKDDEFDRKLQYMLPHEAAVMNAMAWEAEDTIAAWMKELENNGRFAVKHGKLEFGVATDGVQSAEAFFNKEF